MDALRLYLEHLVKEFSALEVEGEMPELSSLTGSNPGQFGIAVCDLDGRVMSAGANHEFCIQSISKSFAYAAAIDLHGLDYVTDHVDEEPTGEEFNAISVDTRTKKPKNPLVNIGAIRVHAMLGQTPDERTERLHNALEGAAGRALQVHEQTFTEETQTADRNLALAHMLRAVGSMNEPAQEVVNGYLRGCAVLVTVSDLAMMAATLATGGVNPSTGKRVFSVSAARQVLSVMLTCGMYDNAGDWVSDVGLPAKSGVSGGIIASLPARFGIATYAPRLDEHGNSVRGTLAFEKISADFGLHMLSGAPPSNVEAQAQQLLHERLVGLSRRS